MKVQGVRNCAPEGFIERERSRSKSEFHHQFLYTEDVIRNLAFDVEVNERK